MNVAMLFAFGVAQSAYMVSTSRLIEVLCINIVNILYAA